MYRNIRLVGQIFANGATLIRQPVIIEALCEALRVEPRLSIHVPSVSFQDRLTIDTDLTGWLVVTFHCLKDLVDLDGGR